MKKYCLCGSCKKKIYFGDTAYVHPNYQGVYCCFVCYARTYSDHKRRELTKELAEDHGEEVYEVKK